MPDLASPVVDYICDLSIKDRSPAYLLLTSEGIIKTYGGNLSMYGIDDLNGGEEVGEKVTFLEGFFPLDDDQLFLACIQTDKGIPADVHIFSSEQGYWVLLLDATEKEAHRVVLQQKANELSLLRDKHAKILDQYLGKEIADKLMHLNIREAGESKYVSILFADICSFTSYSETHTPEEVFKQLNTYLAYMIQAVLDEGGIIDKIIGDAVMAIFGVLPSGMSPSVLAVKAAMRMLEDIRSLNNDKNTQNQNTFEVSVGIATGNVFLGILGSKHRRTLSAIGHYVNLAARLEGQARQNEILIDKSTFTEIPDFRTCFVKTRLNLKGIREPVEAFSYQPDSCGANDDRN